MLKRNITYEDFNGDTCTETFYFNISKPEIVELQYSEADGFDEVFRRIVKAEDNKSLIAIFKKLILDSYGQKSPDGKRFIKTDQLREEFSQTAAYQSLFMELASDDTVAATFILGIFPRDMSEAMEKQIQAQNPTAETMIKNAQKAVDEGRLVPDSALLPPMTAPTHPVIS